MEPSKLPVAVAVTADGEELSPYDPNTSFEVLEIPEVQPLGRAASPADWEHSLLSATPETDERTARNVKSSKLSPSPPISLAASLGLMAQPPAGTDDHTCETPNAMSTENVGLSPTTTQEAVQMSGLENGDASAAIPTDSLSGSGDCVVNGETEEASDKLVDLFGSHELHEAMRGWLYQEKDVSRYTCIICDKPYPTLQSIHAHLFRHSLVPVTCCMYCHRAATSVAPLKHHFSQEHSGEPLSVIYLKVNKATLLDKLTSHQSSTEDPVGYFEMICHGIIKLFDKGIRMAEESEGVAEKDAHPDSPASHTALLLPVGMESLPEGESSSGGTECIAEGAKSSDGEEIIGQNLPLGDPENHQDNQPSDPENHQDNQPSDPENQDNQPSDPENPVLDSSSSDEENTSAAVLVKLKCKSCSFSLPRSKETLLKKHVQEHPNLTKLSMCGHCSFLYYRENLLKHHNRLRHPEEPQKSLPVPWTMFFNEVAETASSSSQSLSSPLNTSGFSPSEDKEINADSNEHGAELCDNTEEGQKSDEVSVQSLSTRQKVLDQTSPTKKMKRLYQDSINSDSTSTGSSDGEGERRVRKRVALKNRNVAKKAKQEIYKQLSSNSGDESSINASIQNEVVSVRNTVNNTTDSIHLVQAGTGTVNSTSGCMPKRIKMSSRAAQNNGDSSSTSTLANSAPRTSENAVDASETSSHLTPFTTAEILHSLTRTPTSDVKLSDHSKPTVVLDDFVLLKGSAFKEWFCACSVNALDVYGLKREKLQVFVFTHSAPDVPQQDNDQP